MLDAIWQLKSEAQWLLLLAFVVLAVLRGAGPERQVAGVFVGMFVFDRLYHAALGLGWHFLKIDLGHVVIDTIAFTAFVWIALRANRVYPLWVASFQLLTIVSHIVRGLSPAIMNGAYAILMFTPSYLEVGTFGLGTLLHIRRQAKFGRYQSWLNSLDHLPV